MKFLKKLTLYREIDFIVKDHHHGKYQKYQVTTALTAENKNRELQAFLSADQYMNKVSNILLTMEEDEKILHIDGTSIMQKYIPKWLLEPIKT